jgi:hypothetical protein
MAMVAYFGMSFSRGATVTAFSFAAFSRAPYVASRPGRRFSSFGIRRSGILSSTVEATADVTTGKVMSIEHPSYDIVTSDMVSEYGAATTLYRHKKSGAELLSVSTEDDNKVCSKKLRWHSYTLLELVLTHCCNNKNIFRSLESPSEPHPKILQVFLTFLSIPFFVEVASIQQRIHLSSSFRVPYRLF